jgi:hypothetical protein
VSNNNRLKFWRTSAAKTVGVTAALAVFGSVLVASPASAVDNDIAVEYWVNGPDSANVCVNFYPGDSLASFPDTSTPDPDDTTYTDVEEALTVDSVNSGQLAEATIDYVGTDNTNCDFEYSITDIYVGDWNEIYFRFDAWITDGLNDVWAEGSTQNHEVALAYSGDPDFIYSVDTAEISEESVSEVGLAHNNDYITDERHAAFYCLDNDASDTDWVDDLGDNDNDWQTWSEDVINDPIVYVYDLTDGEFVADTSGDTVSDITITDADDEEYNFEHCASDDREFWIEGLELGHTYEFQAQYEVHTVMTFEDGNDGDGITDFTTNVNTLGFDRSVNFTPLDIRQNLVSVLPSDNDGEDGEDNYWTDEVELDNESGWYWNGFQTGDSTLYEGNQYTNVDVILPFIQGELDGDYTNLDALASADIQDKWYVSDEWDANDSDSYDYYDGDFSIYDKNDWGWDHNEDTTACEINGNDVNDYDENFSDYCDDYGTNWYFWRGNADMHDDGDWGHLNGFEGQAFVTLEDWEQTSDDDINDYQDENDVLEGMSNSYSSNYDWDFQSDMVRATGTDSIQLALGTGVGFDYYENDRVIEESVNVGDSLATFHIRLLPNYGEDADTDLQDGDYENGSSEDGMDGYQGNESYPESRLYAVDYTFGPEDYWYDGFDEDDNSGDGNKSVVVFDLESYDQDEDGELEPWETLEPGTTYSVEVMATFDTIEDDSIEDQWGDGGYGFVSFGSYNNSFATTYLESHVDVVSENTAKFEVNLQDSHYTDRSNLDQAGYLAWTECEDWEEGVDCSQYLTGIDSDQDFNIADINRINIASDASVEFIDGDKHLVFTRSDLNADTSYQVVFGMDYWQTQSGIADESQESLRKEMEDTLDNTNCDYDGFWDFDTDNGTDCYNSTSNNDLYRSDVTEFRTFGAPELDAVSTVDNDAAQDGTDTNTNIELEFSENVVAGSGLIQIVRASDDKVVRSIRPSASSNVAIDGNVVTVDLGMNLDYSTTYHVYVAAGTFADEDGVHFAGNDNAVTTFTTEDKPEEIGSVDIKMLGNFKRTISVDLKKAAAFETVQVWWHEHQSTKLFYAGSITLDENGNGDITRVLPRLGMRDNVIVTHGRHTVASQIVATS